MLKIALFSPSSPPLPEKVEKGLEILEKEAPNIRIMHPPAKVCGPSPMPYLAAGDKEQARCLLSLLESTEPDYLWGTRGGYGILRWATMIDLSRLRSQSMPTIVGFSDLTLLHLLMLKRSIKGIHGPLISTLPGTCPEDRHALFKCMKDGKAPTLKGRGLFPGRAKGILVGGNLTCLVSSLSTALEPDWDGKILFMEDHRESLYRIDRMLTQLLAAGRLRRLSGIAAGRFLDYGAEEKDLENLLRERLGGLNIPVIRDLPIGHGSRNAPVISGAMYSISGDEALLVPVEGL